MNRPPTPIEVWGPAFDWLDDLTVDNTQSTSGDQVWCRLCESWLPWRPEERETHVEAHRRERADWKHGHARAQAKEARARIATINRERRLQRHVLEGRGS